MRQFRLPLAYVRWRSYIVFCVFSRTDDNNYRTGYYFRLSCHRGKIRWKLISESKYTSTRMSCWPCWMLQMRIVWHVTSQVACMRRWRKLRPIISSASPIWLSSDGVAARESNSRDNSLLLLTLKVLKSMPSRWVNVVLKRGTGRQTNLTRKRKRSRIKWDSFWDAFYLL